MTKQATLGPIDPSVNTPLNPQVPGAPPDAKVPVSVEAIKGFLSLAKEELRIKRQAGLVGILTALSDKVHPLVLGEVYRATSQIRMLARRLVARQVQDKAKADALVNFLCSESGSHDYTIHRGEAKEGLGLHIEKPDDALYSLIKRIYDDMSAELQLTSRLDLMSELGGQPQKTYAFRRALIESVAGGSHVFVSEGSLMKVPIPTPDGTMTMNAIQDQRDFEGWRLEHG
jgi:hypothetical protein